MIFVTGSFLFLILGGGLSISAQASICYDVINTAHSCPQRKISNTEGPLPNYNTAESQKASLRRATVEALTTRCVNHTQTAQNITDIHTAIESAKLEDNEKFICQMFVEVRKQNAQTLEERRFMLEYINKQEAQKAITKEDKIQMAALLIKYRLLENKNKVCSTYAVSGVCYFSATRFSVPQEMHQKIQNSAESHVHQFKDGPAGCIVNGQRKPLSLCAEEIKSRVAPIPAPLILAQITQESGWGASAWAKNYNNYLGLQHKFNNPSTMACYKNCRCAGAQKNRCAMKFENITGCLYEYYTRFNASPLEGYQKFRKERGSLPQGKDIDTQCQNTRKLIPHLKVYAEDTNYLEHICHSVNTQTCNMMKKCPAFQIQMASLK